MQGQVVTSVHRFTLLYALPPKAAEEGFMAKLFSAGCNDALVGLGRPGFAALEFEREGADRQQVVLAARQAVTLAWPDACLLQIR